MEETAVMAPYVTVEETLRRTERVGACPVLRVQVTYPRLVCGEDDGAARRFNETYRRAAEAFVAWGVETAAPEARTAFAAMGAGAAYRFLRREISCAVTVDCAEGTNMVVTTVASWRIRGDEKCQKIFEDQMIWRFPQGWVADTDRPGLVKLPKLHKVSKNY